jgi:hypothetical protein
VLSIESFKQVCVGVAKALCILQAASSNKDLKEVVQQYLSSS